MNTQHLVLSLIVATSVVVLYVVYRILSGYRLYMINQRVRRKLSDGAEYDPAVLFYRYTARASSGNRYTAGFLPIEKYQMNAIFSDRIHVYTEVPKGAYPRRKAWKYTNLKNIYHYCTIKHLLTSQP